MRKQKGFSLIELLIVVAIILIIAAIAIPNLLRSRIAANEASAVGSLRTYNTALITYASTYPDTGFAPDLASLGPAGTTPSSGAAGLLDSVLAGTSPSTTTPIKSGYKFTYTPQTGGNSNWVSYKIEGDPTARGSSGQRGFFTDESAVIRFDPGATAVATSSPLQ